MIVSSIFKKTEKAEWKKQVESLKMKFILESISKKLIKKQKKIDKRSKKLKKKVKAKFEVE